MTYLNGELSVTQRDGINLEMAAMDGAKDQTLQGCNVIAVTSTPQTPTTLCTSALNCLQSWRPTNKFPCLAFNEATFAGRAANALIDSAIMCTSAGLVANGVYQLGSAIYQVVTGSDTRVIPQEVIAGRDPNAPCSTFGDVAANPLFGLENDSNQTKTATCNVYSTDGIRIHSTQLNVSANTTYVSPFDLTDARDVLCKKAELKSFRLTCDNLKGVMPDSQGNVVGILKFK